MKHTALQPVLVEPGLPTALDAERLLISSVMLKSSRLPEIASKLRTDDFALESHRRIWSRMLALYEMGVEFDRYTLASELHRCKELESVGGLSFLTDLEEGMPIIPDLSGYVRAIQEKSKLRRLMVLGQDLMNRAGDGIDSSEEILSDVEQSLVGLANHRSDRGLMNSLEIIEETEGGINVFLDPAKREQGTPSGFSRLDELTGGMRAGELTILAARPAHGKTAMALNIAWHIATRLFQPVAFFSLEMTRQSLLTRALCAAGRVDSQRFRAGYLNEKERESLMKAAHTAVESSLMIDDTAGTTLIDVRAKVTQAMQKLGRPMGLVIVDYLQLMSSKKKSENRTQEVSELSRGLKLLSKELGCPFLVLSQLSRAVETRAGDHRPQLSDLRESGCLSGETQIPIADKGIYADISSLVGVEDLKVWALNESTQGVEMVSGHAFKSGTKPVFLLKTKLGKEIRATGNHKFLTVDGWIPLRNIGKGIRVALPRVLRPQMEQSLPHPELALMAHMIGNGTGLPRQPVHYVTPDPVLAEYVCLYAKQIFGDAVRTRWQKSKAGNWYESFFSSARTPSRKFRSPVVRWLESIGLYGKRSHEKFIPALVFAQPDEQIAFFLRHLWSTDGCYSDPGPFYSTTSLTMARQVQSLLLRLGITALLRKQKNGSHRLGYNVIVSGKDDVIRFLDTVGAIGTYRIAAAKTLREDTEALTSNTNRDVIPAAIWEKTILPICERLGYTQRGFQAAIGSSYSGTSLYLQNLGRGRLSRIAETLQSDELRALAAGDVYWDEVVEVMEDGISDVFDIEVPSHHNFVAADIYVHNSIEQDADVVAFIYREEVYKKDREDLHGVAELILSKQRQGPCGVVPLVFLSALTKFETRAGAKDEEAERLPYGDN